MVPKNNLTESFNQPHAAMTLPVNTNLQGVSMGKTYVYKNDVLPIPPDDTHFGMKRAEFDALESKQAGDVKEQFIKDQIALLNTARALTIGTFEERYASVCQNMTVEMVGAADKTAFVELAMAMDKAFLENKIIPKIAEGKTAALATDLAYRAEIKSARSKPETEHLADEFVHVFVVMQHHLRSDKKSLALIEDAPPGAIILTDNMPLSDILLGIKKDTGERLLGAVVNENSSTKGHAAIIAKSLGIPYACLHDSEALSQVQNNTYCIVDGRKGEMYIAPNQAMREQYAKIIEKNAEQHEKYRRKWEKSKTVTTLDKEKVGFHANFGTCVEINALKKSNPKGIGLYRTEMVVGMRANSSEGLADSSFWYDVIKTNTEACAPEGSAVMPATIRYLDVGGDKCSFEKETVKNIHYAQTEAVLRRHHELKDIRKANSIKLEMPMLSTVEQYVKKQAMIDAIAEKNGWDSMHLGVMVETPAAMDVVKIVRPAFMSLGMNDLVQYTLGIDRFSKDASQQYDYTHPTIARYVRELVAFEKQTEAEGKKSPLSICGDAASDTKHHAYFVGLGLREFSCAIDMIPELKEVASRLDTAEAEALSTFVDQHHERDEREAIEAWFNETRLGLHPDGTLEEKWERPQNPLDFDDFANFVLVQPNAEGNPDLAVS